MAGRGNRHRDDNGWDEWGGYMSAKIQKLQQQYLNNAPHLAENSVTTTIFKGIAIFVNGYTVPSAEELKRLMAIHGGIYHHYFDKQNTNFIIATNLAQAKIKGLTTEKLVTPNWITDSITAGKVLPYQNYQLYGAASKNQGTLQFQTTSENGTSKQAIKNDIGFPGKANSLCATDSEFLSEFYNHSRLHYISTLAAELKSYISKKRLEFNGVFDGYQKIEKWKNENSNISEILNEKSEGVYMHIDMDCFFVSVGLRNKPELKGKPVAVTHSRGIGSRTIKNAAVRSIEKEYYKNKRMINSKQSLPAVLEGEEDEQNEVNYYNIEEESEDGFISTSEIASCSYEARKCGIKNGMFLGEAKKLCPDLHLISYDFDGYREVAYTLYDTVTSYTLNVEAVSCDEMYIDCTDLLRETQIAPLEFAAILRKDITEKTRCNCSAGLGNNMLIARLATRKAKPNGQFYVPKRDSIDFISEHLVDDIPGVGWSLSSRLKSMRASTCGDLQKLTLVNLQAEFGPKTGQMLYKMCRGVDEREIKLDQKRKSVSAEVNYGIRFTQDSEATKFLSELSEEVAKRLSEVGMCGKTITLKLKVRKKDAPTESSKFMGHGICDSISRSNTLLSATGDSNIISREAQTLLQAMKIPVADLRGIGIQVQRLEEISQVNKNGQTNNVMLKFLSAQPSTSTSTENARVKNKNNGEISLPPPSQVDHEFLAELPEDIRQQICQEYEHTGIKLLPERKRRISPKKPKTSPRKRRKMNSSPKKKLTESLEAHFLPRQNNSNNNCKQISKSEQKPVTNLCGRSELDDIKSLISEWISTCSEPEFDDINTITVYLKEVAVEKNLERVYVLLKYLKRVIPQSDLNLWTNALNEIINEVQELVVTIYGAPLKL